MISSSTPVQGTKGPRPTAALPKQPVLSLPLEENILDAFQVLVRTLPQQPAGGAEEQLCRACREKIRREWYTPMERFMREV